MEQSRVGIIIPTVLTLVVVAGCALVFLQRGVMPTTRVIGWSRLPGERPAACLVHNDVLVTVRVVGWRVSVETWSGLVVSTRETIDLVTLTLAYRPPDVRAAGRAGLPAPTRAGTPQPPLRQLDVLRSPAVGQRAPTQTEPGRFMRRGHLHMHCYLRKPSSPQELRDVLVHVRPGDAGRMELDP